MWLARWIVFLKGITQVAIRFRKNKEEGMLFIEQLPEFSTISLCLMESISVRFLIP